MPELLFALLAGLAAGVINAVVGSGTLLTFPVLLAAGLPPVSANVTNALGLVPGAFSGAWGYRRELSDQRRRVAWLLPASIAGGLAGAVLLLVLPEKAFGAVVPALVVLAVLLVLAQPFLQRAHRARRERIGVGRDPLLVAVPLVAATGVYGGYFGAAQGVLLLGGLGAVFDDDLQRLNALKNVLAGSVNLVAAVLFLVLAPTEIAWRYALVLAIGSLVGGLLGGRYGRLLPPALLRGVVVVVGLTAVVFLLR